MTNGIAKKCSRDVLGMFSAITIFTIHTQTQERYQIEISGIKYNNFVNFNIYNYNFQNFLITIDLNFGNGI